MRFYRVKSADGIRLYRGDDEAHAREQHADCFPEPILACEFTGEYSCPECEHGCYTIRDNSDAPIPIRVPPSVHDDEGRPASFCPVCDTELTPEALTGVTA